MGGYEIINPNLNMSYPDPNDALEGMFLPELALHYMEHGSFDCYGDVHTGRVDIPRLLRVLESRFPCDPNEHRLAVEKHDLDGDLLSDGEELSAGYNLYNADQTKISPPMESSWPDNVPRLLMICRFSIPTVRKSSI